MNFSYFRRKGEMTLRRKIYLLILLIIGAFLFSGATYASLVHKHD